MSAFLLQSDIDDVCAGLRHDDVRMLAGKHVLINGGRGFLGRYFTEVFAALNRSSLVDSPVRVTCIDNFISSGAAGRELPNYPHVTFVEHDVINGWPSLEMIHGIAGRDHAPTPVNADFIIHAAGIASPAHYRAHPLETLDVAVTGLRNSLELARMTPHSRLVFFSSSEIYGDPTEGNVPTPETYRGNVSCLGPRACYDESKRLGETLCRIYSEKFGVHTSIIRPFNVYGPGMQATDYRVLPNFAARIAKGLPLEVYGDGKQTRTYCYVSDAMTGFLRVLLSGTSGEPYNIGNPTPEISVNDLAKLIANGKITPFDHIDAEIKPHPPSYPADEPNRRCPDIRKAAQEVGYEPRVPLEEGLRRFFNWALDVYPKA